MIKVEILETKMRGLRVRANRNSGDPCGDWSHVKCLRA